MKKLLSMLLVLAMSMMAVVAVAEDAPEYPAMTVEATFEGVDYVIGETGYGISRPADWVEAAAPEGYLAAFTSPDNTLTLSIQLGQGIDACYTAVSEMVTAGTAKDLQEVLINDVYYMLYTSADGLFDFAYLPVNDEQCVIFCFGAPSADVDRAIESQVIGTVYALEAETEAAAE